MRSKLCSLYFFQLILTDCGSISSDLLSVIAIPKTIFSRQVVESCVEGIKKPEQSIFELTLKKLGVESNEAVFLDDLGDNLKTARLMGMTTIKVCSHIQYNVVYQVDDPLPGHRYLQSTGNAGEDHK